MTMDNGNDMWTKGTHLRTTCEHAGSIMGMSWQHHWNMGTFWEHENKTKDGIFSNVRCLPNTLAN
jgi:hypothetical protein